MLIVVAPKFETPTIMARKTIARMRPYSMAVAPWSSLNIAKKRRIALFP
jgi:hypothetical protein